jgi:hypothetical protein
MLTKRWTLGDGAWAERAEKTEKTTEAGKTEKSLDKRIG